ncbi:uncharacterized protein LOC125709938 isoform X1 [Brienomyrus brachyistius]|uniref:uncharacterized protein LOC125709938 isoform X1 n=1 Tax=Brienomyrus brachyistius TaxID=42636 RepID=UPI0020B30BA3|nr:uncharacterized protein LOC125709938 isoform X1 [Brienomyrus brachyistius]
MANPASYTFSSPRRSSGLHSKHTHQSAITPPTALEYVRNGRKVLMDVLKFPITVAKQLNKHGILSEEELCDIRRQSGGADATSKLLDMVIAKGEQACCELLQILHNKRQNMLDIGLSESVKATLQSLEEDLYHWINHFSGLARKSSSILSGNDLHLNVKEHEDEAVFEEARRIMQQSPEKMQLYLHVDQDFQHLGEAVKNLIFKCLPQISRIRLPSPSENFVLQLFFQAAINDVKTGEKTVTWLSKVIDFNSNDFDVESYNYSDELSWKKTDFLLDLHSHIKDYETETGLSVQSILQPVYQSAPEVWVVDLSKRKASILLEVMEFQTNKKPVKIISCSDTEKEQWHFLQCLPYISHLGWSKSHFNLKEAIKFMVNLFNQAAECDRKTGEKKLQLLSSVCSYSSFPFFGDKNCEDLKKQSDFLLDLYTYLKDSDHPSYKHVLLELQSAPAVWVIDLSERKASILLEVLELQTVKKPVKLVGWSDEKNDQWSLLKCLPYVSKLGLPVKYFNSNEAIEFMVNLFNQAAECDIKTGEKKLQFLSSVCSYSSFPFVGHRSSNDYSKKQSDFLLDLYSFLKDSKKPSYKHVLLALQPVYESAPAFWVIDLSKRKASILLEVLELQTVKKPVKLVGWSNEKTEIRSFLQCLPYVSQLRWSKCHFNSKEAIKFMISQAAECDRETGEKKLQLLSSVCSYSSFPFAGDTNTDDDLKKQSEFLLDLYSFLKDSDHPSYKQVVLALQPVYQSAPAVWVIDLSERKASILLEVLEFQTVKKPVKLVGWSDEENEQSNFLQCLPNVSELGFSQDNLSPFQRLPVRYFNSNEAIKFMVSLFSQAAECDIKTGEKKLQLLSSVCSYSSFPFVGDRNSNDYSKKQSDFLLDLYSFLKDSKNPSYKHVLLALQPVYQSAPAVWVIDLSKRKASILLEVLELQTVKKPVKLVGWSNVETEIRSFLQCLPYVSQLGLPEWHFSSQEAIKFLISLFIQAAECDTKTGEKKLQLLSSVCSYSSFPFVGDTNSDDESKKQSDFLLDLYSFLKYSNNPSYKHVLLALQPVYQSAPAVWVIDLSKRKASILLEVLEFQIVKKPVKLVGWSHAETELRSFLKCLPFVSQLGLHFPPETTSGPITVPLIRGLPVRHFNSKEAIKFIVSLFIQAAECDIKTGEKKLQLLSSVCSYSSFPLAADRNSDNESQKQSDFLLDLYSYLKDSEDKANEHVLQALLPVYQSAPAVWFIDLTRKKASIIFEVLEFQTMKKPVKLVGWSDEENEIKSFLQCLPYISQLGLYERHFNSEKAIKFMVNLFNQAAECDIKTGEKKLQLLSSVCSYSSFPFGDTNSNDDSKKQTDFMLDLYSFLKDSKNPSYKHVLLSLQPVYQSAPAVWVIVLSERKASILPEVLELQRVKKPVKLVGWLDEETEIRSFLQCLPYITQLGLYERHFNSEETIEFMVNLFNQAAECDIKTGEKKLQLLSSVCSYSSFPFAGDTNSNDDSKKQTDFMLDLYSFLKDSKNPSYKQVLLALQPVYQSAPAVWVIDLSERKASILPEVLEFQRVKKPVKLVGWLDEETEIRSFLQCLPYISQLGPCNNKITDMKTFLRDPDHDLWDQSKNQNTVEFKPDLNDHNGELSYSFSCESGGHFQCSATGLVFQMKAAGKVEYSPTYWDEAALKTAGYQPAGPLFNIENPDKGLCSLQLPHCEADVEERVHLSVAHFYSGNMEVLKPFAVTDTHVTMQIGNLSAFGIIKSVLSLITSQVRGQVLLFQPPRSTPQEQIYVFLLPSNVPLDQVTKQHTECRYIKTSSDCTFIRNQKYKVTSDLEGHHEIQPESQDFFCNYGPNFHPTFEVFFNDGITALKLAVMKNGEKVWGRRVRLPAEVAPDANQLAEKKPISLSPWKDFLLDVFDDLTDEELKNLKTRMPPPAGCKGIPKSKLQGADRTDLWNLMAESWGMEGSIMAIKGGLSKIQRNDLIEELNDFPKKLKKSSA